MDTHGFVHHYAPTDDTKGSYVADGLKAIRTKCEKLNVELPPYYTVDDCCAQRPMIRSIMGQDAIVTMDYKHLVNRLLEECYKGCDLFTDFSLKLHQAYSGVSHATVQGRDDKFYKVKPKYDDGHTIWARVLALVNEYKLLQNDTVYVFKWTHIIK
jgi:hypothetical protein